MYSFASVQQPLNTSLLLALLQSQNYRFCLSNCCTPCSTTAKMPKQLSVVCPQCKQGLTIDFENRKMAITCPDCQKLFRIGNVVDTVVAKKSGAPVSPSSSSNSNLTQPSYKRPTGRLKASDSWEPTSERTREFARRKRKLEMSSAEESLQAGGFFMMVIAILGSLLPAIYFQFGQLVMPPIPCMALCGMAGLGGVIMILVANIRHNLPVAIAWSFSLAILALTTWVLCFDISRLDSPFRYAARPTDNSQKLDSENQNTGSTSTNSAPTNSTPKSTRGQKIKLTPQAQPPTPAVAVDPYGGSTNSDDGLAPNESRKDDRLLVRDFDERPSEKDVLPSEKKLDKLQRQFGSEGTIKSDTNNWGEIQQDLEMRFKDLNQTSVLDGVAQSHSFNKKYVLSSVVGKQTNFGDALFDGRALRGVDVSMGRKRSGLKYVLPILDQPKFSNSLFADGYFLTGLNVHVNDGRLVGLQCVVTKGTDASEFLDETDRARTPWRGLPIKGPASVNSDNQKIYGLVTYTELDRLVGIQLILKR